MWGHEPVKLTTMAIEFLRIGATGFGGPMALIGLMHRRLVEKSGQVTEDDFAEGVAIGQVLPGPVAVDCATHIGYRLRGLAGAAVSTGAIVLPAFALMLVLTPLYLAHGHVPQVGGFFSGVGPAVVAVILTAAWRLAPRFITGWKTACIALAVGAGALAGAHPILLILAAGLVGVLTHRPGGEEGDEE